MHYVGVGKLSDETKQNSPVARKPPTGVNIQFVSSWQIILPTVYRYENAEWINRFFEFGELQLSTFSKFATYEDEVRGDPNEGRGVAFGFSDKQTTVIAAGQGSDAFVLCCSSLLNRGLQTKFERDSAFAIENTQSFAYEVSRQLQGFRQGLEGHCIYRSSTTIEREFSVDMKKYKLPEGGVDMQMIFDTASALGGPERLLLKLKEYETQREYRLLWHVDHVEDDYIKIRCPLAVKHCRQLDKSDYE